MRSYIVNELNTNLKQLKQLTSQRQLQITH